MSTIRTYLKFSLVAAAAIILTACSSGPKIYVNEDPNADLGGFKTFGFEPRLGTDRGDGTQSLLSQFFINAAKQEMELRGYIYTPDSPDLGINFYVSTKEKIRSTSTPTAGGYYGYRGGYYGSYGGYETTVKQYTEGTVTIDLINMSTDKLVWEGTAVGRISSDVQENLEEAVDEVVLEIFTKYQTRQGGGAYKPPKK
jgi:hypothetical protein